MSPFPLHFCLSHLAIQIPLVRLSWFAWRQRFIFLSFYMPLKGKHQPATKATQFILIIFILIESKMPEKGSSSPFIMSASASSCTGATGTSSQLIVDFLPKASCRHLLVEQQRKKVKTIIVTIIFFYACGVHNLNSSTGSRSH